MIKSLTVNSFTGKNKKPASGYVTFSDKPGSVYLWSYAIEKNEEGRWVEGERITLMGSKKLSLGHTHYTFYSAKREIAIREYLENNY